MTNWIVKFYYLRKEHPSKVLILIHEIVLYSLHILLLVVMQSLFLKKENRYNVNSFFYRTVPFCRGSDRECSTTCCQVSHISQGNFTLTK